ncbi:MAG: family 43 glycosylhydrolase [Opitutales bacterium]|nr:family 43 glycosylhydrolase [Opitutales bacterium]
MCAFAELKDDVSGFKTKPKNITPKGFFEGSNLMKRNGKYYLMYYDVIFFKDTYCVKYAVIDTPEGPFVYGKNNPILETHFPTRTYGPGHHSTIKIGEKYYIVYHKMEYPRMFEGRSGSRQTCIDELRFDADGNILKIVPTKTGVELDILKNAKNQNQIFPVKVASSKSSGKTPNYYKPEMAFDDSFDTIWEPDMRQTNVWLAADLGKSCEIEAFEPVFAEVRANVIYKIETSNALVENISDVKDWQLYGEFRNGDVNEWPHRIQKSVKARFVRLSVLNFNSRGGIWEFKIFGK